MTAEELRIGDWVTDDATHHPVQLRGVNTERVNIVDRDGDVTIKIDELSPIPLTGDILTANGWIWNETTECFEYHDGVYKYLYLAYGKDANVFHAYKITSAHDTYLIHLRYLHELQNLCSALKIEWEVKL